MHLPRARQLLLSARTSYKVTSLEPVPEIPTTNGNPSPCQRPARLTDLSPQFFFFPTPSRDRDPPSPPRRAYHAPVASPPLSLLSPPSVFPLKPTSPSSQTHLLFFSPPSPPPHQSYNSQTAPSSPRHPKPPPATLSHRHLLPHRHNAPRQRNRDHDRRRRRHAGPHDPDLLAAGPRRGHHGRRERAGARHGQGRRRVGGAPGHCGHQQYVSPPFLPPAFPVSSTAAEEATSEGSRC